MATDIGAGVIESRKDYDKTPKGQFEYWDEEIKASMKARKEWHRQGDRIVKRYLDFRRNTDQQDIYTSIPFRLNLFHSNVTTLTSMLYGKIPTVDVSRRYADAQDDVGRVAAEIMERMLNNEIAENGEEVNSVLRSALQDRLLPGLGCARVRYDVETEKTTVSVEQPNEAGEIEMVEIEEERVVWEDAPIDYFFWRDVLWGWGRNWSEIPWLAYRVWLTKDEVEERFGEKAAKELQYKRQLVTENEDMMDDPENSSPWNKAEIWEIWDKESKSIYFYSKGYRKILDRIEDPLGLSGFFPSPPFFLANPTTTLYQPTPDFHLSQQLYDEIDKLQTRIAIITEAVKVVGVYDSSSEGISRMFKEGIDNQLIPVDSWALFGEKGGLQGQIDWVPIQDIVNSLDKLRELRNETIQLLHQVTGMADVMRGGSEGQYEGVGQAQLKAKYGSIRVQALQDEFAVFASDLMQLKAEVISLHFSPETIAKRSNIASTPDAQLAPQAIELIKQPDEAKLRVEIRPESVAMVDYAQLKAERTDYINAIAVFMQSASPLIEQDKSSMPFLLQLLQWGLAGFKGSQEIEGVIDRAIEQAQKAAQQPQPDPAQQQQQLEQAKAQIELSKIQAKAAADAQTRQMDLQADLQTVQANHQAKLREIEAEMMASIAETQAKMEADNLNEKAQAHWNIVQAQATAEAEMAKDAQEFELDMAAEVAKTNMKITEVGAQTAAKIKEAQMKPTKESGDD